MRIALDVDDCITNTLEWDFACAWEFNRSHHPEDNNFYYTIHHTAPEIFKFTPDESREFYIKQRKFLIDKRLLFPKPFVKEVIDKLLQEGHEIFILTSREDTYWNGDAQGETKKWLKKYKIGYTDLFANCVEKGLKCAELKVDLLIDDNQKFAQQVNAQGIRSIILSAPYNLKYKNVLSTHASCWPEVYYIIQDLQASLNEYRKAKLEKERLMPHIHFEPITAKTLVKAVKLQQRITKNHCAYLEYQRAIKTEYPYYFIYDGDEAIGITGFYVLSSAPEDVWLGVGGIVPSHIRQGYGKKVMDKLMSMAKEKGFKTFRILTNFVQNPNSQTLFRQVSDICEVYKEDNEKSAKRYIYSKSLTDAPVKKWKNKDCNAKEFARLEKESKKIMKEIS